MTCPAPAGAAAVAPQDEAVGACAASQPPASTADALFTLQYRELRRIAARQLRWGGGGVTMGATTLLHEAYLRIARAQAEPQFSSPGHFTAFVASVMRTAIVDRARARARHKRGGGYRFVTLDTDMAARLASPEQVVQLDEHLKELEALAPDLARLVELRFFAGMTESEAAAALGRSLRSVQRDWEKARRLLAAMMSGQTFGEPQQGR